QGDRSRLFAPGTTDPPSRCGHALRRFGGDDPRAARERGLAHGRGEGRPGPRRTPPLVCRQPALRGGVRGRVPRDAQEPRGQTVPRVRREGEGEGLRGGQAPGRGDRRGTVCRVILEGDLVVVVAVHGTPRLTAPPRPGRRGRRRRAAPRGRTAPDVRRGP